MSTEVNKAIQELLFEQTAVIVPGLGGFTSTPGPATVDYVQDVITPPTSKLDFNPNLVINDGVLVQFLQKSNLSTYQAAEALVEKFVASVRETLERREIFEIPKVGRLYQDYEHKIRFMPEGTNFNAASFGLPTVEFQPLVKEKTKLMPAPPRPAADYEDLDTASENGVDTPTQAIDEPPISMAKKVLPWMVLLVAILIALVIYHYFGGQRQAVAEAPTAIDRVNVKPTETEDVATVPLTEEEAQVPETQTQVIAEQPVLPPVAEQKTIPPAPPATQLSKPATTPPKVAEPEPSAKAKVFLVVHSFGVKGNASKFAKTLSGDGYATQTKKVGSLFRVGVLIPADSQNDVENTRNILANKYKAGPKTEKELEEMGQ